MAAWDPSCIVEGAASLKCLESLFSSVVEGLVALSGIALFVMFVIGGFSFLFSGGDQKKLEQARGTLTNAIVGLVVIIAAYLILKTIGVFTGLNVTQFTIPTN